MRGRVVSDGEGVASAGNVANIVTVARILLAAGTLPPGEPASASDAVLAVLESL